MSAQGWATGRGVGSVVPQDARSHPELLLTEEEISHIQDLFRAIDLNGNGVLEKRELFHFCEENARMTTRMMTEIDANSDGKVFTHPLTPTLVKLQMYHSVTQSTGARLAADLPHAVHCR